MVFRNVKNQSDFDEIMKWVRDNLPFDQIIKERGSSSYWLHISATKRQSRKSVLTRVRPGKYVPGIVTIK